MFVHVTKSEAAADVGSGAVERPSSASSLFRFQVFVEIHHQRKSFKTNTVPHLRKLESVFSL